MKKAVSPDTTLQPLLSASAVPAPRLPKDTRLHRELDQADQDSKEKLAPFYSERCPATFTAQMARHVHTATLPAARSLPAVDSLRYEPCILAAEISSL